MEESKKAYDHKLLHMNQVIPVEVKILEIEWLSESMPDLYVFMSKLEDNSLFGNEFIKILLEQQDYTMQIFMKVFVPYIVYTFISLIYMSLWVPVTVCDSFTCEDNDGSTTGLWLRSLMLFFGAVFLFIEMM